MLPTIASLRGLSKVHYVVSAEFAKGFTIPLAGKKSAWASPFGANLARGGGKVSCL